MQTAGAVGDFTHSFQFPLKKRRQQRRKLVSLIHEFQKPVTLVIFPCLIALNMNYQCFENHFSHRTGIVYDERMKKHYNVWDEYVESIFFIYWGSQTYNTYI